MRYENEEVCLFSFDKFMCVCVICGGEGEKKGGGGNWFQKWVQKILYVRGLLFRE